MMEDPLAVLMSICYEGNQDADSQKRIEETLSQDPRLLGYMSMYVCALLYGFRCVSLSYDEYLYDLHSSRIWEEFALCGKGYVRSSKYEKLTKFCMDRIGYPTSERTLEDVVHEIHDDIRRNRSED